MITKECLVYVGKSNPPDYCPDNFINEVDLLAVLKVRIQDIFYSFGEKTIMNCPRCKVLTEANHLHNCAHGIESTHMSGSERYECVGCGYKMFKTEGEEQGLRFFLD